MYMVVIANRNFADKKHEGGAERVPAGLESYVFSLTKHSLPVDPSHS